MNKTCTLIYATIALALTSVVQAADKLPDFLNKIQLHNFDGYELTPDGTGVSVYRLPAETRGHLSEAGQKQMTGARSGEIRFVLKDGAKLDGIEADIRPPTAEELPPVLVSYGTSISQGAAASEPGLSFTALTAAALGYSRSSSAAQKIRPNRTRQPMPRQEVRDMPGCGRVGGRAHPGELLRGLPSRTKWWWLGEEMLLVKT